MSLPYVTSISAPVRPFFLLFAACALAACDGTVNFTTPDATPPAGPLAGTYGAELRLGPDPLIVDVGDVCPVGPPWGPPQPCPPAGPRTDTTVFTYALRLVAETAGRPERGRFLVERTAARFSDEAPGEPLGIDEDVFVGQFRASGDTIWFEGDAPRFFRAYRDSLVLREWPFQPTPTTKPGPIVTPVLCWPWRPDGAAGFCSGVFYRTAGR